MSTTTFDLIRTQQALAAATQQARTAQKSSDAERIAQAFAPLLQIWDDVKDLPSKDFRHYSAKIIPLQSHRSCGGGPTTLWFNGGDGNTSLGVHACITNIGTIQFNITQGGYSGTSRICTLQEAIEALTGYLARFAILPE